MRTFLLLAAFSAASSQVFAQEVHDHQESQNAPALQLSAKAIALGTLTNVSPGHRRLAEGYLTQPSVMAMYKSPGGIFKVSGMLNFEGVTLKRGELSPGIWGEGYVDRRHPHTYLHEATISALTPRAFRGTTASLTFGKGFVSFGTDDPMVRPFVKYPVNHHLAQVLERVFLTAAVRRGPMTAEFTRFNGDEPQSPGDAPNFDRLGDSWAARLTSQLAGTTEIQSSFAHVASPENAGGGGVDQRKLSVSARYEHAGSYALVEFARTGEEANGKPTFRFRSFLAEASIVANEYTIAARVEVTERPEEERLSNSFRTRVPHSDLHLNGITRWPIASVAIAAPNQKIARALIAPFIELSAMRPSATIPNSVFDPRTFYGTRALWNFSAGLRFAAGHSHSRMGRYGILSQH